MDISLILSVLGVVLTVAFFVVGYRQTIGARKERARAANKELVVTLFRRFTLEKTFETSLEGIEKIVIQINSLDRAKKYLQSKKMLGDISGKSILIDQQTLGGLLIELVEN